MFDSILQWGICQIEDIKVDVNRRKNKTFFTKFKIFQRGILDNIMVKCPKCGNESWSRVSDVTIIDEYLKAMKENLPPYKYRIEHPDG
ncbi:MAG: hypothetical protein OEM28_01580 [Nitrosopumilus sp.]|nr:hypothetical protein [Nitrosopumilus sp.]